MSRSRSSAGTKARWWVERSSASSVAAPRKMARASAATSTGTATSASEVPSEKRSRARSSRRKPVGSVRAAARISRRRAARGVGNLLLRYLTSLPLAEADLPGAALSGALPLHLDLVAGAVGAQRDGEILEREEPG